MGCDVPVVAADIPVFREIAEDAVLYADPVKFESIAAAMEEGLASHTHRQTLIDRARPEAGVALQRGALHEISVQRIQ